MTDNERALDRMEVRVETNWPDRGHGPAAIGRAILSFFSEGLFSPGPKSRVRVVDRLSGEVILEHDWGRSVEAAEQDRASLERQLASSTVAGFCAHHGVRPPVGH